MAGWLDSAFNPASFIGSSGGILPPWLGAGPASRGADPAPARLASLAAPATEPAGIADRLQAGLLGFAHSGGPLPAIANLISGLATGQRSDPQAMMLAQQAATVRALRGAGVANAEAIAAMHPALARVLLAHAYPPP